MTVFRDDKICAFVRRDVGCTGMDILRIMFYFLSKARKIQFPAIKQIGCIKLYFI